MSIEKNIERIADALEIILKNQKGSDTVFKQDIPIKKETKKEVKQEVKQEVKKEVKKELTLEEANNLLMIEYKRFNDDKKPIEEVFSKYGAQGLTSLDPSKYAEVIKEVQAYKK